MSILNTAAKLIDGDRQDTYGSATESFDRIGKLWSAYLGTEVSGTDVANLMVLLKVSRTKGKFHEDSYVDIAGYAALAERLQLRVWDHLRDVPAGMLVSCAHDDDNIYITKSGEGWYIDVEAGYPAHEPDGWSISAHHDDEIGPFTEVLK